MTREELYQIRVPAVDQEVAGQVQSNWDSIAKPLRGMGKFEEMTARIGAMTGTAEVEIYPRTVLVFCGDNGIVEEGVSQSGQEVTAAVMASMVRGQSSVCKMAAAANTEVKIIDIGVSQEYRPEQETSVYQNRKVRKGTRNFLKQPAMTEQEVLQAISIGMELAGQCKKEGCKLLALGEMGIGNTTTSSAVAAALTGCPVEAITGKGAGLDEEGLTRKQQVIRTALKQYDLQQEDPLTILMTVGGLDLAGLAGACIGAALCRIPVVLDGVISAAAALTAQRMVPGVRNYLIASHTSREPAAAGLLRELGLSPVLNAELALGEGTGAVLLFAMLDPVLAVYESRTDFQAIGIAQYEYFDQAEQSGK